MHFIKSIQSIGNNLTAEPGCKDFISADLEFTKVTQTYHMTDMSHITWLGEVTTDLNH